MPRLPHHQRALAACVPLLAALALPAQAAFISSSSGLAGPHQSLDFEAVLLPQNTVVDTQFAGVGVTFGNAIGNPDPSAGYPNISGNRIGNFRGGVGSLGTLTMDFSSVLDTAAFSMITGNGGTSTLAAYLGSTLVESVTIATNSFSLDNYHTFSGILFDRVTLSVSSFDNALMIDNLQTVAAPVPEPAGWALLLASLAALKLCAWRRQVPRR